jgi:dTMP kinase
MFFSFDGIDGVGKSTQLALFLKALDDRGHRYVACRDPGSTALGEAIRELLLQSDDNLAIARRSEMFLYMAARSQLVEEVIRPALDARKIVVSDRYLLANLVYQGHAGGIDIESVRQVGALATDGIVPDAVFLLDLPPDEADARLNRARDRMESQGIDYRRRLRQGFLDEAARSPGRIHVIDAGRPVEAVQADIWRIAEPLLQTVQ